MSKIEEYRALFDGFLCVSVPAENGDYLAYCPAHENPATSNKPSCNINFTPRNKARYPNGVIHCHVCNFTGKDAGLDNIAELYRARVDSGVKFGKVDRQERVHKFTGVAHKHDLPDEETRKVYRQSLFRNKAVLQTLKDKRGLTDETIRKFQIGWMSARNAYCYPVYKDGKIYAMRLYRIDPRAKVRHGWYNSKEEHTPQLFGTAGLENEPIVILTEGEFDMFLARQDGLKAVTHNGGAAKFRPEWIPWFRDKVVYVAYDADDAGHKGRTLVARLLKGTARAVYFVDFPGPRGTDYTDYRIRDGHSVDDFNSLLMESRTQGPEVENVQTDTGLVLSGKPVTIAESMSSKYVGVPLEMTVQVLGRFDPPYVVPGKVHFECTTDKGEKYCSVCPLQRGHLDLEIRKDSPLIQKIVESREADVEKLLIKESGARCKDKITDIERTEEWAVEQIVVGESVETRRDDLAVHALSKSDTNLVMLNVDTSDSEVNEIYRVVGNNTPAPRTQRLTFTSWHREQTKTNIDQFEMTPETFEQLKVFRPRLIQTVYGKMEEIAHDLTRNVAGVVDREDLAVAYDIAWHSALSFYFRDKLDERGWVELLVFGDTRTGKSDTAHKLAAWYRNGKIFSSEGATRAGLVGGATQPSGSKHWIATWGAIPQNDRRLIVLDEAQALVDIVKDMGSIRSKGVAEMVKVGINQSTLARTRLVWICNPISQGKLGEMADGAMTALSEFMPATEDRARFDLAVAVASSDVSATAIHKGIMQKPTKPKFSSEACEKLILWAWSRKPEQIKWAEGAEEHVLKVSNLIVEDYDHGNFELVQASNMHIKLARISVAIAARTFSSDETGENIVVMPKHVDAAKIAIDKAYQNPALGLGRASRRAKIESEIAEANVANVLQWFKTGKAPGWPPFGEIAYRGLRNTNGRFKPQSFYIFASTQQDTAMEIISHLADMSMIRHDPASQEIIVGKEMLDAIRDMELEQ